MRKDCVAEETFCGGSKILLRETDYLEGEDPYVEGKPFSGRTILTLRNIFFCRRQLTLWKRCTRWRKILVWKKGSSVEQRSLVGENVSAEERFIGRRMELSCHKCSFGGGKFLSRATSPSVED